MDNIKANIRFEKLGKQRTFASEELQARADSNPLQKGRDQYRVWLEGREAAYVSFDIRGKDELNLYEVFVVEELRKHGVGTEIVLFAIELAKKLEKQRLTVRPGQIADQSEADLVAWYERRGLAPSADDPDLLEIKLT